MKIVTAILLVLLLAWICPGARADLAPDIEACITKARAEAITRAQVPRAIITDLAGPQEEFFLTNLSRLEAYNFRHADVVLTRFPGKGWALVTVFQAGCLIADLEYPNLYIVVLLAMPEEREI
jgi:hypothetical protein